MKINGELDRKQNDSEVGATGPVARTTSCWVIARPRPRRLPSISRRYFNLSESFVNIADCDKCIENCNIASNKRMFLCSPAVTELKLHWSLLVLRGQGAAFG